MDNWFRPAKKMGRKSRIFSVGLAGTITLSCICITAQPNVAPSNQGKPRPTAESPQPRRANRVADGPDQGQQRGETNQAPTTATAPANESNRAADTRGDRAQVATEDKQQPENQAVAVRSLPALHIPRDWVDYTQIFLTIILIGTTIGAGVVAYLAFADQRDAVRVTQRADVLVESIKTSDGGPLQPETVIEIVFKNYGPTRANAVVLDAWMGVEGSQTNESEPIPATSLGAGDTVPYRFHPMNIHLTPAGFIGVQTGTLTLRIVGTLTYKDVFKRPHSLEFIAQWHNEANVFSTEKNDTD